MTARPVVLLIALLLAGCAKDVVVIDRGIGVVEAGQPVIENSRKLLSDAAATNHEAKLELAVFDRSCIWPDVTIADRPAGGALCGEPGTRFLDISPETLKPTISLIAALNAYVAAIDGIVSENPDDSAAALATAHADLEGLLSFGASVTGGTPPTLLNEGQLAAAKSLVGLIGQVAQQRRQADALRTLEAQSPQVEADIARLERDLKRWSAVVIESDLDTIDAIYGRRAERLRKSADDGSYRQFLTQWQQLKDRKAATAALPTELAKALAALKSAHREYVNIIADESLSPGNRKLLAAATRKRLSAALSAVAGAVRAFL